MEITKSFDIKYFVNYVCENSLKKHLQYFPTKFVI